MEFFLLLVTGGMMLAVIGAATFRSKSRGGSINNIRKKTSVGGGRESALALDEAYRSGIGASFGRSYIGLEGTHNDPFK